jgi:hypothetical protein
MTVVIPLKNDGRYDQLRFALRSITTHHNITRCILVGGKPDWYTGEHIPHKDYGPVFKEANIRDKVLAAGDVGRFLFANDDHILMAPISSTWNKGSLSVCLKNRIGNGSYTRCLRNTLEHYGDVPNIDIHCPMFMTSEGVQRTNFEWPEYGIGFKTCYAQENQVESVYIEDCKVDKLPSGRTWFSMTDAFNVRQLVEIFPKACFLEKEYIP